MNIEQLMKLRNSPDAPFDHEAYTVWLHNKILDSVHWELSQFREKKSLDIKSSYAACNMIMVLPSLKRI